MSKETMKLTSNVGVNALHREINDQLGPATQKVFASSTSKAAQFWRLLDTEREFSAAYLNAVLANDDKAIVDALGKVGLSPDEVDLSKEEVAAFMHGHTPSGAVEISSLGGYYVTKPHSNGDVFALLISSADNRVFWGPVDGFFAKNWSNSEVKYQLGSNATISFSTSAGDVVLTFSRDFDEKQGTVGDTSFKGTLNGVPISGTQKTPPTDESLKKKFFSNTTETDIEDPSFWSQAFTVNTTIAFVTGLSIREIIFWTCRQGYQWRVPGLQRLVKRVEDCAAWVIALKKRRVMKTNVRLDVGRDKFSLETTQKLNEALREAEVDYNKMSIDEIIEKYELKQVANEALNQSITDYVKARLGTIAQQELGDLWKDAEKRAEEVVLLEVDDRTKVKTHSAMTGFNQESTGIKAFVNSVVYEGRKEFYNTHAESLEAKRSAAAAAAQTAKETQQTLLGDLKQVKEDYDRLIEEGKVEEAKKKLERSQQLGKDIRDQEQIERDKKQEAEQAARDKTAAEGEREASDKESKKAKGDVDREMREHFKP